MKKVLKKANLASVIDPELVTLTKSPANRIGFKIIRSGGEEKAMRTDGFLLSINLPEGVTAEDAQRIGEEFGLDEQYAIVERDGMYSLCRADLVEQKSFDNSISVPLSSGATAIIDAEAFQRGDEFIENQEKAIADDCKENQAIRLVSIRFDREKFSAPAEVDTWLGDNDIDYPANGVEQLDDSYVVTRSETEADICEVPFAEGVVGTICRAEKLDYPNALYGRTVEQAYGDWGWGQLDFMAMKADREFSAHAEDAIYMLRSVLDNIVFYSELPLETRKQLIVNAVSGYAVYTLGLIDALPKAVIEQTRSDEQINGQENDMSKEAKTAAESEGVDTKVERTETEAESKSGQETEQTSEKSPESEFVTRGELKEVVTEAVAAAIGAGSEGKDEGEKATRSEEESSESEGEGDKLDKLIGVVGDMATAMKGIQDEQKTLRSEFDEAEEGTTTTRSSNASEGVSEETKRDESDPANVFEGVFGRRSVS